MSSFSFRMRLFAHLDLNFLFPSSRSSESGRAGQRGQHYRGWSVGTRTLCEYAAGGRGGGEASGLVSSSMARWTWVTTTKLTSCSCCVSVVECWDTLGHLSETQADWTSTSSSCRSWGQSGELPGESHRDNPVLSPHVMGNPSTHPTPCFPELVPWPLLKAGGRICSQTPGPEEQGAQWQPTGWHSPWRAKGKF